MSKKIHFTTEPSEPYFTFEGHLKNALKEQVTSISYRGRDFKALFRSTCDHLRKMAELPEEFHVFFTSSVTDIWERSLQNCVESSTFHLVNGAFSESYWKTSTALGLQGLKTVVPEGSCVDVGSIDIPEQVELIAITHNEASTGAAQPLPDITALRQRYPEKLIAVDMASSFPYVDIDYCQVDMAFFSVQQCFGLPAGLGVWFVNDRCLEKSRLLQSKGQYTGGYHSLTTLWSYAQEYEIPGTPNILTLYLLDKVSKDMLTKGMVNIRRETDYKAAVLYHTLENHALLQPFVREDSYRSKTTIVAQTEGHAPDFHDTLRRKGLILGTGHGKYRSRQLQIANFPTHSKEQIEMLCDFIEDISI